MKRGFLIKYTIPILLTLILFLNTGCSPDESLAGKASAFLKIKEVPPKDKLTLETNYFISGKIKNKGGIPLKDTEVAVHYQISQGENIYRIGIAKKKSDKNGLFYFTEKDLAKGFTSVVLTGYKAPSKPWPLYLQVNREGYLDVFVYGASTVAYQQQEVPKLLSNTPWLVDTIFLTKIPRQQSVLAEDHFEVHFYPGQEACAEIALEKLKEFYPQVEAALGIEPGYAKTKFQFKTKLQQGSGDWTGGEVISTVCYPWTDDIKNQKIEKMWKGAIPHELGHHFVWHMLTFLPYWANEGLAQYTKFTINKNTFSCNPADLLPIKDLAGEQIPKYNSAACAWKLLEKEKPGFIKEVMALLQEKEKLYSGQANTDGYFIKSILSTVYGKDLTSFFVENFQFNAEELEQENAQVIAALSKCPSSCDDKNPSTEDTCFINLKANVVKCDHIKK